MADALKQHLELLGAQVTGPAATTAEATKLMTERLPHVALVDFHLRGGDSSGLIAQLREEGVPVIMLSGSFEFPAPASLEGVTMVGETNQRNPQNAQRRLPVYSPLGPLVPPQHRAAYCLRLLTDSRASRCSVNSRRLDSKADSACTASNVEAPAARRPAIRLFCSATTFCASHTRRWARARGSSSAMMLPRSVRVWYMALAVSPWKCARLLKALNLNHRQIVEAALIRAEAIGRTEPHTEVAMKDQAERFPTVVASHGFNMRQMSSLALHLRSPRVSPITQTNAKTFGGFPMVAELLDVEGIRIVKYLPGNGGASSQAAE